MADVVAAIERIVAGLERKGRLLNPKEREAVAWHEMGHALAAASLPGADPVQKVSIIPRSIGALGYTMTRPTEDRFLITRADLENRMVVLLAGRAAEDLVLGEFSTGAAHDLARVTGIGTERVIAWTWVVGAVLGRRARRAVERSVLADNGPRAAAGEHDGGALRGRHRHEHFAAADGIAVAGGVAVVEQHVPGREADGRALRVDCLPDPHAPQTMTGRPPTSAEPRCRTRRACSPATRRHPAC
jgi:hypothetical protein